MDKNKVYGIFKRMKRCAALYEKFNNHDLCIKYTQAACWWAYYFNVSFSDDQLENITQKLSQTIRKTTPSDSNDNSVVFYDSFGFDHRGLTQQYIRAIMAYGYKLLYLTDATADSPITKHIYAELRANTNTEIINVPQNLHGIKRAQYIYDAIINYGACKVFMHLMPDAIETIMAMQALPNTITRYQINLTDHTFWIGATALDYSFEFRPFGMKASTKYRHIDEKKLLLCPYYPIIEDTPFKGFPLQKKSGEVILFSGGSAYKFIDDQSTYAKIVKRILDENLNAVWIHAGDGEGAIWHMFDSVMDETYRKRVYLIGHRDDIAQIVNHIDIYVSSYPMAGGLMSLYAAYYKKPILVLKGGYSSIDEIVGQLQTIELGLDSIDNVCEEAKRLIEDTQYREMRGEQVNRCVVTEDRFNEMFPQLCVSHKNVLSYVLPEDAQLPDMDEKIVYENRTGECVNKVEGLLQGHSIWLSHVFVLPVIQHYKRRVIRKIKKIIRI